MFKKFFASIGNALRSLNSHFVANAGLSASLGSLVALGAQHAVDSTLAAHAGPVWDAARGVFDAYVANVAVPAITAGSAAAYLGRPKTVPAGP